MNRLQRAVAALLAPALVGLPACGGSPDGDAGTREEPAAERTTGQPSRASDADAGAAAEGEDHAPSESSDHAHGPATHTHARTSADTLTAAAALRSAGDGGSLGSVTVLAMGDSARIVVEIHGVEAGLRYATELAGGDCAVPGDPLASLTPVMAGSSGAGSSQTTVAPATIGRHAHGTVRLSGPTGEVVACAPVHLPGSHTHEGG